MANQCVILVGGLGTRLGALTKATPKPLLDVAGAPFLETLFGEARRRGFDEFLLLAGHRAEALTAFLAEREIERRFACRVELSIEPSPLGTGGALVHALDKLHDDFLLLNGDTWFDFNWLDLVARSRRDAAAAGLGLRPIERPDRYDTVELDGSRVVAIHKRGRPLEVAPIVGGVYYLTRRAIEGLAAPASLEADLLPGLIAEGSLRGYPYSGFFIDIGVPETLAAAADLVPRHRRRPAAIFALGALVAADATAGRGFWAPGATEAVKRLNDAGFYVFVVAGGKAREPGEPDLAAIGAYVDDWDGSNHDPRGAIAALMARWPVELRGSFCVGAVPQMLDAATAAGVAAHCFEGGDLLAFLAERRLGAGEAPPAAKRAG